MMAYPLVCSDMGCYEAWLHVKLVSWEELFSGNHFQSLGCGNHPVLSLLCTLVLLP